jgi:glycerophosphoryl diester phosphodiesterase
MINTETGTSRFTITFQDGARQLLSTNPVIGPDSITIDGIFGDGDNMPSRRLTLVYERPLHNRNGFQIMAHRAGGRTSDHLNVSENSVAMIKKTAAFGSTGIEIDVRLTSDRVPILYHDNTVNDRLVQPNGMTGPIENYSYTQLSHLARLINGEKIPTLHEALETVVYNTDLEYVWLDTKYSGDMNLIRQVQAEYLQKAAAAGRDLQILIGLPGDDQLSDFKELPDYQNIPSLCELTRENVREINAKVWAPRWTLGTQDEEVAGVHAEGRKAFTWTLDVPEYISLFINNGDFDGILSNYPSAVAYYEYVK